MLPYAPAERDLDQASLFNPEVELEFSGKSRSAKQPGLGAARRAILHANIKPPDGGGIDEPSKNRGGHRDAVCAFEPHQGLM